MNQVDSSQIDWQKVKGSESMKSQTDRHEAFTVSLSFDTTSVSGDKTGCLEIGGSLIFPVRVSLSKINCSGWL